MSNQVNNLGKFATTGDGLLVALEVIQALNKNLKASKFFNVFEKFSDFNKY